MRHHSLRPSYHLLHAAACRRLLWTAFLILLSLRRTALTAHAISTCDSACQQQQRQALLEIYDSLYGPYWKVRNSSGAITTWGSENVASLSAPEHCFWSHVYCCGTTGTYIVPAPYPTASCYVEYGVGILLLTNNALSGNLPHITSVWQALAPSSAVLDLSGASSPLLSPICWVTDQECSCCY